MGRATHIETSKNLGLSTNRLQRDKSSRSESGKDGKGGTQGGGVAKGFNPGALKAGSGSSGSSGRAGFQSQKRQRPKAGAGRGPRSSFAARAVGALSKGLASKSQVRPSDDEGSGSKYELEDDFRRQVIKEQKFSRDSSRKKKSTCCSCLLQALHRHSFEEMGANDECKELLKELHMKRSSMSHLYYIFEDMDFDEAGIIEYGEYPRWLGFQQNFFTNALFDTCSKGERKMLTFSEFFQVTCMFCLWSKEELMKFAFTTFDKDSSGRIDKSEFYKLCINVNNSQDVQFQGNLEPAIAEFEKMNDLYGDIINWREFRDLNSRFQMLLQPLFRLQMTMQRRTLGEDTWLGFSKNKENARLLQEFEKVHGEKAAGGKVPPRSEWADRGGPSKKKSSSKTSDKGDSSGSASPRPGSPRPTLPPKKKDSKKKDKDKKKESKKKKDKDKKDNEKKKKKKKKEEPA